MGLVMSERDPGGEPSPADWRAIRSEFSCTQHQAYLNTGTLGPVPDPILARYVSYLQEWNSAGPGNPVIYRSWHERTETTRAHLATWLHVPPTTLALTGNVTDALNIGLMGLDLKPGSRVITTDEEHGALVAPLGLLAAQGVQVDIVPFGEGGDGLLARVEAALATPADLVVLSHVSCDTGWWVDGRQLAQLVHQRGAVLMLDGAQSAGQLSLDLTAMEVDLYGVNGHKWLLGPVGTGALYVSPAMADRLHMRMSGSDSGWSSDYPQSVSSRWVPEARRYEYATRPWAAFAAWHDVLSYWEAVGVDRALARQRQLAASMRGALSAVPGIIFRSPPEPMTGITALGLPNWHGQELAAALRARSVVGRPIRAYVIDGVRLSTSFFNDDADIARAQETLMELAERGPSSAGV